MDIYNVNLALISKRKRLGNFFVLFAIYIPVYFAIELLWPGHRGRDSVLGMSVQAVLWGFVMSVMFSFMRPAEYQIVVDDDAISTKNFKSNNRLFSRTVRRDQVRTVIERKQGLLISRHSRFGTFLWGGIWVPKELAEYEYLKRLVFSWRVEKPT